MSFLRWAGRVILAYLIAGLIVFGGMWAIVEATVWIVGL